MISTIRIRYAAESDTGFKRENNEDAFRIEKSTCGNDSPGNGGILFAVADGMGGHACGEIASEMACKGVEGILNECDERPEVFQRRLIERFHTIDDRIRAHSMLVPSCAHMGTTLSTIAIFGATAVIAHVGDTRIYHLRGGSLTLLTTDHTFVQEMLDEGELTPEEAASHPFRNMLTGVIGTEEPLEQVDTRRFDLAPGDRFLLCSDGLHDAVSFGEVEEILRENTDPDDAVRRLISLALDRGGKDNITVIVVHISQTAGKTS
ncbi:MAG: PP2C family protein-serine/threonine phosphatase [Desulfobacterales bacterium]